MIQDNNFKQGFVPFLDHFKAFKFNLNLDIQYTEFVNGFLCVWSIKCRKCSFLNIVKTMFHIHWCQNCETLSCKLHLYFPTSIWRAVMSRPDSGHQNPDWMSTFLRLLGFDWKLAKFLGGHILGFLSSWLLRLTLTIARLNARINSVVTSILMTFNKTFYASP